MAQLALRGFLRNRPSSATARLTRASTAACETFCIVISISPGGRIDETSGDMRLVFGVSVACVITTVAGRDEVGGGGHRCAK